MNNIYDAASNFVKLLDVEYKILLGKKGNVVELDICFDKSHFFHLAGLQYLKDIHDLDNQREYIFDRILSKKITAEKIESSMFYSKIQRRVHFLAMLESIFDSNDTIFKYDATKNILTSKIAADFLMKTNLELTNIFTFLDKRRDNKYYCRSFFPQDFKDYSYRQRQWTILSKIKIIQSTKTEITLYKR